MSANIIFWIVLSAVLGVIELATVALVTIWVAIGALCAAIAAIFGANTFVQVVVFVVVSAVLLVFTRPIANRIKVSHDTPTNADRFIGAEGIVIKAIEKDSAPGQVKVGGQVWSAISENGEDIAEGERVKILRISGVKLIVKKILAE